MSGTLAPVTAEMAALAAASPDQNVHRADEPYRRALIASTPGLRRRCITSPAPRRCGTPSCRSTATPTRSLPARPAGDPALAAGAARAGAGRAAAGAADARGAGLRLPPRDAGSAPEFGQARGRGRRVAARGTPGARLRRAARAGAAGLPARAAERRPAAACARRRIFDAGTGRTGHLRNRQAGPGRLRPRGHPPLHHLAHRRGERPARGAAAAEGDRPADRHARRHRADAGARRVDHGAAVRDHRRPAPQRTHHARVLRPARHPRTGAEQRRRAGCDAGLQATATRTAVSSPATGSSTAPRRRWWRCSRSSAGRATARARSRCACSTAAAAPSGAAAGPATRPSWRSRPAR